MIRLSSKCQKAALQLDPTTGCRAKARDATEAACKGVSGRGLTNCKSTNYNRFLAKYCADVVCPGDPFAIEDPGLKLTASTTAYQAGAEEGVHYGEKSADIATSQEFETSGGGLTKDDGGTDPTKVRTYLAIGVGLLVLLAITRK